MQFYQPPVGLRLRAKPAASIMDVISTATTTAGITTLYVTKWLVVRLCCVALLDPVQLHIHKYT